MNLFNILSEIEKTDADIYERLSPRRKVMKDFYNVGKKISLAALPVALSSMFSKAYGQSSGAAVAEVLNFALTLEYLEYHFYNHALVAAPGLIPSGAPTGAITTIRDHEKAHVNLLRSALGAAARSELKYENFDFTAGGTFSDVYSNYNTFLKVATAFEDTGVRAYKGQAPVLKGNAVLTTALQIHSVEARHASHLRQMTAARLNVPLKPWITYTANGNDTGVTAANPVYAGEQNTKQAGIEVTNIASGVTQAAAAESFDEFLTKQQVVAIANLFLKAGSKL